MSTDSSPEVSTLTENAKAPGRQDTGRIAPSFLCDLASPPLFANQERTMWPK